VKQSEQELAAELGRLEASGLLRTLRALEGPQAASVQFEGRSAANFSSNDYLGLAAHPALCDAAKEAVDRFGAGAGSARLISGNQPPHIELEQVLAEFKGSEAALAFSSGYATAMGVIPALVGPGDTVVIDKLSHACLVDAAKLSGAKLRVFRHNDLNSLEDRLQWASQRGETNSNGRRSRILIVTESVFSMDGDLAPLLNLVELKERYGAWLMVDEAHATGIFGEHRRGLIEEFGVADRVDAQMGTLGKALGASGGYVCGPRTLIDLLINKARSFVFSTAPTPATAAAARAGIELTRSDEGYARCQRLWNVVDLLKNELIRMGWSLAPVRSAIIPLIIGDEERALKVAVRLLEQGVFAPAIRYPTVARGSARLRITASAAHEETHLRQLFAALSADPGQS
jgi:8-amino-7-oxononanoate synthase